jgi:hypothetical protein
VPRGFGKLIKTVLWRRVVPRSKFSGVDENHTFVVVGKGAAFADDIDTPSQSTH